MPVVTNSVPPHEAGALQRLGSKEAAEKIEHGSHAFCSLREGDFGFPKQMLKCPVSSAGYCPESLLKQGFGKSREKKLRFPKQPHVICTNLLRSENYIWCFKKSRCFMIRHYVASKDERDKLVERIVRDIDVCRWLHCVSIN